MTATVQPTLVAYAVEDTPRGKKAFWTPIGRMFSHKDGKGFDLVLNALPTNGRVVIREKETDSADE